MFCYAHTLMLELEQICNHLLFDHVHTKPHYKASLQCGTTNCIFEVAQLRVPWPKPVDCGSLNRWINLHGTTSSAFGCPEFFSHLEYIWFAFELTCTHMLCFCWLIQATWKMRGALNILRQWKGSAGATSWHARLQCFEAERRQMSHLPHTIISTHETSQWAAEASASYVKLLHIVGQTLWNSKNNRLVRLQGPLMQIILYIG